MIYSDTNHWGAGGHLSCPCGGPQLKAPQAKQWWIHCTGGPCWKNRKSLLTDALSVEKEVSSSVLWPILKHVLDNYLAAKPDDDHLVTEMKSVIARELCTHYESALISQLPDKCSILDLKFKTTYIVDRADRVWIASRRHLSQWHIKCPVWPS